MSSIDPKLKRLNEFPDPARAIPQLEQNVSDAFDRVAAQALPLSTPTEKKLAACSAVVGQTIVVAGTVPVVFPVASRTNVGQRVTVELQSGSAIVTTASGTVQGAASDSLSTVGRYEYESDGAGGWWRPPAGAVSSVSGGASPLVTVSPTTGAVVVSGNEDRVKLIASYHP